MLPKLEFILYEKIHKPGNRVEGLLKINNFIYIGVKTLKLTLIGLIENKTDYLKQLDILDYESFEEILNKQEIYNFNDGKFYSSIKHITNNILLEPTQYEIKVSIQIPNTNLPSSY